MESEIDQRCASEIIADANAAKSTPDNVWLIRQRLARLVAAAGMELHEEASKFSDWLVSKIGRYEDVYGSPAYPGPLQIDTEKPTRWKQG